VTDQRVIGAYGSSLGGWMRRCTVVGIVLGLAAFSPGVGAAKQMDVAAGERVCLGYCVRCHGVE